MSADCIASLELFVVPPGWLFLKVTTEEGWVGWGEPSVTGKPERVAMAVQEMADFVAGHPVDRIEDLFQGLHRGGFYQGGALMISAISGIEQALWDIKGRRLGMPVHDMLGGVVRNRIPGAGWVMSADSGGMAAQATRHREAGFGAVSLRVASLQGEDAGCYAARVLAEMETVREALGEAPGIAVEFERPLPAEVAEKVLADLAIFNPLFMSNPVELGVAGSWLDVSGGRAGRLACGGVNPGELDVHAAIGARQAEVFQPDLNRVGGIWELRKIAVLSEQHDVALAPTGRCGPIALAASLHVGFAASCVLMQETAVGLPGTGDVAPVDYLGGSGFFAMRGGAFEPNGRPGLGIEVDEGLVRDLHEQACRWANPVWRDELETAVGW